jgi:hypothetical protein
MQSIKYFRPMSLRKIHKSILALDIEAQSKNGPTPGQNLVFI